MIEEQIRRNVHEFYLVPDGVKKTIAVLEDAPYEPPASQLEAVPDAQRERLQADLRLGRGSLRYRWARATMLMASLNQMGAGTVHPLRKAAFEPFAEDFDAIHSRHKTSSTRYREPHQIGHPGKRGSPQTIGRTCCSGKSTRTSAGGSDNRPTVTARSSRRWMRLASRSRSSKAAGCLISWLRRLVSSLA